MENAEALVLNNICEVIEYYFIKGITLAQTM